VGGRYSLWSAIGLPIAIAIGADNFRALLAGAHAMDSTSPGAAGTQPAGAAGPARRLVSQLPRLHEPQRGAVSPGPARLPAYLQQLEMESNGKCVDLDGQALPFATSPVVWGEPGTNGQHAYFQMLHQGTDVIPVEFILVKRPTMARRPCSDLPTASQAACQLPRAEPGADAGQDGAEALNERRLPPPPRWTATVLPATAAFPGNRPSTTLVLDALTPRSLVRLIALYEHRVFVSGALWGINSFDQWGVELGKACATTVAAAPGVGRRGGPGRIDRRPAEATA
jgi:glucose-6-phosphate isomerase